MPVAAISGQFHQLKVTLGGGESQLTVEGLCWGWERGTAVLYESSTAYLRFLHKSSEPLTSSKASQPVTTILGLNWSIFTFFSSLVFRSSREASERIMIGQQSG